MPSLTEEFARAAQRHPDRIAIVDPDGKEVRLDALHARAMRLAGEWQARGISPGDKVILAMPITSDLYASLAALWAIGATVVFPEPALGLKGLRHAIRVTQPRGLCASGPFIWLKALVPSLWGTRLLTPSGARVAKAHVPHQADPALISFTSGTTGTPKVIPRDHAFLMAQHDAIAPLLASDSPARDLVAFPVFALINLAKGRTSVLPNWKQSQISQVTPGTLSERLKATGATRALLPPALCETLISARDVGALRHVFVGGGPVFPDVVTRLRETHGLSVTCVYGSTEAEPIAHLEGENIEEEDFAAMANGAGLLVGHPVEGLELRIIADEIQVAGPHVNRHYLDPAHEAENKVPDGQRIWHKTGDTGELDAKGRLWLWGRVGSQVQIGGKQIYPFSVEVAARDWLGVHIAALVQEGERPVLCVEGNAAHFPQWQDRARAMGIGTTLHLPQIPMDRRHRSKIDRAALKAMVHAQMSAG